MSKQYEITIEADTNDGDYIKEVSKISEEDLNKIRPLVQAIKEFKGYDTEYTNYRGEIRKGRMDHNWADGDCLREDAGELKPREYYGKTFGIPSEVFDIFEDLLPYNEWGIHTIVEVKVCELPTYEVLL